MRTRIDRPPHADNTLARRQPLHDAIARQTAEFQARGGAIERLAITATGRPGSSYYNGRMVGGVGDMRRAPPRTRRRACAV